MVGMTFGGECTTICRDLRARPYPVNDLLNGHELGTTHSWPPLNSTIETQTGNPTQFRGAQMQYIAHCVRYPFSFRGQYGMFALFLMFINNTGGSRGHL